MYKEYQPCNILSPYIDRYWEYEGETKYGIKFSVPPHGCADVVFTIGNAAAYVDQSLTMHSHCSYFVGPMNTYTELVAHTQNVHILGVRFRPCGLSKFIELPLSELVNQKLYTDDLPTIFEHSFAERLCENNNIQQRINMIEKCLIQQLIHSNRNSDKQIILAVSRIKQGKGKISIKTLSSDICLCQRHFERKFKIYTGYSPKEYSQIVKFWNAIDILRNNTYFNSLLSVAVEAGYYDVPHLSREIKRLSGNTPYAFLNPLIENVVKVIHLEY
ncbi:helix-turn-helix domain-containing protein [Bacteroides ihuae]|uniref:helix-turn-helix domain-containing protein n=1 Tax=Bacteroides ihuae TaxID=1852362 RepID=UPI0008D995D3|nr:AraC family transcriptional regulator [Bacteroides ihuae]